MKKYLFSIALLSLFSSKYKGCAWSDSDYDYFNLFTQTIIRDKSYLPFLHTYSYRFYTDYNSDLISQIPDENIEAWKKYFNNQLTYSETFLLVYKTSLNDLNSLKKGNPENQLLKKLGSSFYRTYTEGIDYLIEAKYLEPYMRINYIEGSDTFYYREDENAKNATNLDYSKTIAALKSLYNAAKNPEIKQRYGFQLVRFNHYTRNYEEAVQAFSTYVAPIKLRSVPYTMALDQLAGAQRGLGLNTEANWNFFQVFKDSRSRKESAFVSMKLTDTASFNNILKRAGTNEEKNMAYFLLGYEDFTNPIPLMEKMYDINPDSEILKVMAARSINEIERTYLPIYYYNSNATDNDQEKPGTSFSSTEKTKETTNEKLSFWEKIVRFFRNLFGGSQPESVEKSDIKSSQDDKQLLDNPNRLPVYSKSNSIYGSESDQQQDFLNDLQRFTSKTKEKSKDEFWQIADAYMMFLKKDYQSSSEILKKIKTSNPQYIEEIKRMKVLNDIVSQPKIDAQYEDHLMRNYAEYFADKKSKNDSTDGNAYYSDGSSTSDFLKDVLANRYFLQAEYGKAFLMNNKLSDLQYNPDSSIVKSVEDFYKKPNKTQFELQIISKSTYDIGNADAFFSIFYGDKAMKSGDFNKAKSYYLKAQGFTGIPRENYYQYNPKTSSYEKLVYDGKTYDGFHNISDFIFGHNTWESFQSSPDKSMKAENYSMFPFIKPVMNKTELAETLIQLKKISAGKDEKAAKANLLIGNLLYNTSILGYYRHVFVMDIDNSNGGKYDFWNTDRKSMYTYYYKNFSDTSYIEPDNFDLSLNYYQKALTISKDKEEKARILFQMASAEQGKYYQYEAKNPANTDYSDPKWYEKNKAYELSMKKVKLDKYKKYFALLKNQYSDTETAKSLMGSCVYFDIFMK